MDTHTPAELTEITTDNHRLLGAAADDIGHIAVRRPDTAEGDRPAVYPDLGAARDSLRDPLTLATPEIGECLPVVDGRRWLTVPEPGDDPA